MNEPLTLEQMREMVNDPDVIGHVVTVYIRGVKCNGILDERTDDGICVSTGANSAWLKEKDYGITWLAYAYPPAHIDREMCVYKTQEGVCKKYSTENEFQYCVEGPCENEVITNADKIRAMSDDELAILLLKYEGTEKIPTPYGGHEHRFHGPKGEACGTKSYALMLWKDWLQEPADETTL